MIKTNQRWKGKSFLVGEINTALEIHLEQAQAIIQNLTLREQCVCIAAIFITNTGYLLGKFPLHITEEQFCQTVWEYCIKYDIDEFFISYPSKVFMVDSYYLEPADYLTMVEINSELRSGYAVLSYFKFDKDYISGYLWASKCGTDLSNWEQYDPQTLKRLNDIDYI